MPTNAQIRQLTGHQPHATTTDLISAHNDKAHQPSTTTTDLIDTAAKENTSAAGLESAEGDEQDTP